MVKMTNSGFQEELKTNTLNFYVIAFFFLQSVKKKNKSQTCSFQVKSFTYFFSTNRCFL